MKKYLLLALHKVKVQLFPGLTNARYTGGSNIGETYVSMWKQLLQNPKTQLFRSSVSATLRSTRLERIPYSERYHWVLGPSEVSESFERNVGDRTLKVLKEGCKGSILPPNNPQSIRVKSILEEIVQGMHSGLRLPNSGRWSTRFDAQHLDGLKWEVVVVDSEDCDGTWYLTNGTIVVFTRFLERLQSDAEVAAILGHEVGHGVARHALEHLTRCFRTIATLPLLMCIPYSEIPVALVFNFISRRREMEADYIELMLMASAGYDPQLVPPLYESRLDILPYRGIFASHPPGHKRAKKLKEPKVMEQAVAIYRDVTSGLGVRSFI
ncbi:hypothetical protein RHMOL_Rhmol07G0028200 [Rhododendron molle]|uniref:Uncharacterized protein n=1 Tax=Rhododendron molle TaxID=49168 RepID=A0ACC0MXM8_RHOML|nr:hypothetical protein RHMOL_Rhmol07G0028200 [Rhododendron molle]